MKPFIEVTLANSYNSKTQVFQTIYVNTSKIISIESRSTFTRLRLSEKVVEEVKETPEEIINKILK